MIETEEAYQANHHLQHAKDLHVTNGISNIPGYVYFSDEQKFKLAIIDADDAKDNESIIRKKRLIYVFLRNKVIVGKVKNLYSNRCQICGLQLKIKKTQYYSEVHHIVPLGNPHNGLDNMKNMLCVCPNCHVLLDLGAIKIVITEIKINHQINPVFVSYHNEIICKAI
ncbi:MAG: hypothetical protein JWR12_3078 [Mucilaginibacter sp.]|nr:hypothetical protein [Mucilaginibacter sp.]